MTEHVLRGFEVISAYEDKDIHIPERKTIESAGYDIESAEDVILLPRQVTVIPTGLKAFMGADEYLAVHIRSGISIKKALMLVNGTGIIDADYYNNEDNEGHILVAFYNLSGESVTIHRGDRIAQGIFCPYLVSSDDRANGVRTGGIGSTGV
jgi:dUTP pyrophosphatase